jgi:hypothetical protein
LATEAEVLKQAGWLAEKLAQPSKPTGILTWSGHGDWLAGRGLVLCPSDVTWAPDAAGHAGLANAISFGQLNKLLAAHAENLTVVLDTCHAGTPAGTKAAETGRPLGLTRRALKQMPGVQETGRAEELEPLAGRVLAATRWDKVAYQSMFDGHHRGVFSWAVSAAIEQWKATQEGHNVRIDLSYAKLVEATRRLLSALWFDQSPELHAPAGVADLAVLHHGLVGQPGETSNMPDGGFKTEQVDPGMKDFVLYVLTDVAGTTVGKVLVTATAGFGYQANTEYYYMYSNLSNSAQVTWTGGSSGSWRRPPAGLGTLSFSMARTPSWTGGTSTGSMLAYSNTGTGQYDGIDWEMSNASGSWSGHITWWHNSTSNLFGPGVVETLTPTSTSFTGYYYTGYPL